MKFIELLNLDPIQESTNLCGLQIPLSQIYTKDGQLSAFSNDVREYWSQAEDEIAAQKKIAIKTFVEAGDDKWGVELSVVYFEQTPVFAFTRHGRYQEDSDVYLFNKHSFEQFEQFVRKYFETVEGELEFCAADECSVPESIGSYNLNAYCDPNLQAKYQIGDIVWAFVPYNHLAYPTQYVIAKVEIQSRKPYSHFNTYHGLQLNRGWKHPATPGKWEMIVGSKGQLSCVYAALDEFSVLGRVAEIPEPEGNVYAMSDAQGVTMESAIYSEDQVLEYIKNKTENQYAK